ncbi:thiamine pyrophosphate-dependent enzyme [Rubrimonas sp.]|uniref:thiamine pyrophosphate-dependent enzyme n=1 Tax=Rubrimonas sp. TaxID=2036015 RepID=UPI002FDECA48
MARLGEQIAAMLTARNVDTAFCAPSPRAAPLWSGAEKAGLRTVSARCGKGAGYMAEGYARATGRTAACLIGGGVGVADIAPALAQAKASGTPMLVVSSCPPSSGAPVGLSRNDDLDDQAEFARALAVDARRIDVAEEAPDALDAALAALEAGYPGPAVIEIPHALLAADAPPLDHAPAPPPPPPGPPPVQIAELIMRLSSARRPVLIFGAEAAGMGASRAMALAELLRAPAFLSSDAAGLLPPGHPLRLGGPLHAAPAQALIAGADCVVAVGVRFSAGEWGFENAAAPRFADDALVRVGLDPKPLSPPLRTAQTVVADAALTAQALIENVAPRDGPHPDLEELRERIAAASPERLRRHQPTIEAIWDILPDAILIGDSCEPARQALFSAAPPAPRRWWSSASALGAQGYALPAAIGAKIGSRRPVVALAGDGGALSTIGELASAIQAGAHVVMLVWNNSGSVALREEMASRGAPLGMADLPPIDFQAVARGFGAAYGRVHGLPYFHEAMKKATARPCATLLEMREEFWFES